MTAIPFDFLHRRTGQSARNTLRLLHCPDPSKTCEVIEGRIAETVTVLQAHHIKRIPRKERKKKVILRREKRLRVF